MTDGRFRSHVEYPEVETAVDTPSDPRVAMILPFSGQQNRTADELLSHLNEVEINSVREACEKFDVRIEGGYQDAEDKACVVNFPAVDENSFTPRGITLGDPGLFQVYIMQRTCENVAEQSPLESDRLLTDAEIAKLEADVTLLTRSREGD